MFRKRRKNNSWKQSIIEYIKCPVLKTKLTKNNTHMIMETTQLQALKDDPLSICSEVQQSKEVRIEVEYMFCNVWPGKMQQDEMLDLIQDVGRELSGANLSQMVFDVVDSILKVMGTTTTSNLLTLFSYLSSIFMSCSETELTVTSVENSILKYKELNILFTAVYIESKFLQFCDPHFTQNLSSPIR